jgi:phage protein D
MATPDIIELDRRHGHFYAPTYQLLVAGDDILLTRGLEVASVQVDATLEGAARFSFTLSNGFDLEHERFREGIESFELGTPVSVAMGYESRTRLAPMFTGMITSVTTSFPAAGSPSIQVSGYDCSYPMTKGRAKRSWDDAKDSDVVASIARKHGLDPRVEDTEVVIEKIEQDESDRAFLQRLAERNGFELYVRHKELFFKRPSYDEAPVVSLDWRQGLRSFNLAANLASTVTKVEVHGWDPKTKQEIVGTATKEDLEGVGNAKASTEYLAKLVGDEGVLRFRWPVYSQAEADRRAKAILKQHSEGFVVGEAESIGLDEIWLDHVVELGGMGHKLDGKFYVESCQHTVDTNGYKTSFRVKEVTL